MQQAGEDGLCHVIADYKIGRRRPKVLPVTGRTLTEGLVAIAQLYLARK